MASIRCLFFNRLMLNLALLLGVMQLLIWHWVSVVWLRQPDARAGWPWSRRCALLVVANGLAVPALRRVRRRPGWGGRLARLYMNAGVATLLVGRRGADVLAGLRPVRGAARSGGRGRRPRLRGVPRGQRAARRLRRGPAALGLQLRSDAGRAHARARRAARASRPRSTGCAWCRSAICTSATGSRASGSRAWSSAATRSSPT